MSDIIPISKLYELLRELLIDFLFEDYEAAKERAKEAYVLAGQFKDLDISTTKPKEEAVQEDV